VALSKIASEDWPAVHTWAGLAEACRYQPWGPNTPDETQEFVAGAVATWSDSPQRRFPYVARLGRDVVGMRELRVRSEIRRQVASFTSSGSVCLSVRTAVVDLEVHGCSREMAAPAQRVAELVDAEPGPGK
jgi:hypothetical protein